MLKSAGDGRWGDLSHVRIRASIMQSLTDPSGSCSTTIRPGHDGRSSSAVAIAIAIAAGVSTGGRLSQDPIPTGGLGRAGKIAI